MLDKIIEKVGDSYFAADDRVWKMVDRFQIGVNRVSLAPIYRYVGECDGVVREFSDDGRAEGFTNDHTQYLDRRVPDQVVLLLDYLAKVNALDLALGERIVIDPVSGEVGRTW